MKLDRLSEYIGADVTDVELATLGDSDFAAIYQAWLDHVVLRFRGQALDAEGLQTFSQRFGPLEEVPLGRMSQEMRNSIANRYVTVISNIIENDRPIGGLGSAEADWHSDMSYNDSPPTASILLSVEIPSRGASTYFVNQYEAYATLPEALKERVEALCLKHDAAHTSVGQLRHGFTEPKDPIDAPGAVHPIVRLHPETGRKALYLGRRDWAYVVGLPLADSERLLDELWSYATQAPFVWRQDWEVGDVIVWDNRCCLHRRDEFDPSTRRLLRRCQVLAKATA